MGRLLPNTSWQARAENGYALACFGIDWTKHTLICPKGNTSVKWLSTEKPSGQNFIHIEFDKSDCLACTERSNCTKSKTGARTIRLYPQPKHELIQNMRHRQKTDDFNVGFVQLVALGPENCEK